MSILSFQGAPQPTGMFVFAPRVIVEIWAGAEGRGIGNVSSRHSFFSEAVNYDERLLASFLALLAQGQISRVVSHHFTKMRKIEAKRSFAP